MGLNVLVVAHAGGEGGEAAVLKEALKRILSPGPAILISPMTKFMLSWLTNQQHCREIAVERDESGARQLKVTLTEKWTPPTLTLSVLAWALAQVRLVCTDRQAVTLAPHRMQRHELPFCVIHRWVLCWTHSLHPSPALGGSSLGCGPRLWILQLQCILILVLLCDKRGIPKCLVYNYYSICVPLIVSYVRPGAGRQGCLQMHVQGEL